MTDNKTDDQSSDILRTIMEESENLPKNIDTVSNLLDDADAMIVSLEAKLKGYKKWYEFLELHLWELMTLEGVTKIDDEMGVTFERSPDLYFSVLKADEPKLMRYLGPSRGLVFGRKPTSRVKSYSKSLFREGESLPDGIQWGTKIAIKVKRKKA